MLPSVPTPSARQACADDNPLAEPWYTNALPEVPR